MRYFFLLLLFTLFSINILAQVPPEAFNYSGAARDASGNPVSDKTIGVEFSILKGSSVGVIQYRERHFVSTDKFGVFNCAIGLGSAHQGIFNSIEWSNDSYFLRVGLDIDGGSNFEVLGTTQLLSVPYALYAKSSTPLAINAGNNVVVTGQGTPAIPYTLSAVGGIGSPIFTVGNGVTDVDGNNYKTIVLGTQEWMAENLKVARYRNGTLIPNIIDSSQWLGLTTGAWCYYNNDAQYDAIYGKLYNWYAAVDTNNICPIGWHVPSYAEWTTLIDFIDPYRGRPLSSYAAGMLKATGTLQTKNGLWQYPNLYANNQSGFSGIPAGRRTDKGIFAGIGGFGDWWCSTTNLITGNAWSGSLAFTVSGIENHVNKKTGFSIRCLKD